MLINKLKLKILLLIAFCFNVCTLYAQINLDNGLIAHYPFSGNVNDISGNNNNAVNFGAINTQDANGSNNSALEFNGTSAHILLPSNPTFNFAPSDSLTISCWVQPYENLNWSKQALIVKSAFDVNSQNANWSYGLYLALNKAMTGYSNNEFLTSSSNIENNKCWYNIVVTYKNGYWYLFVNGKIEAQDLSQTNFISQNPSVTSVLAIGKKGGANGDYFKGKLDEVRIYNRNLSSIEVEALYELNKPTNNFSFIQDICNPKQIILKTESNITNKLYWDFGNGKVDSNKSQVITIYPSFNNYNVQLVTINSNGCADTIQKNVSVFATYNPNVIANKNDTALCAGTSIQLFVNNSPSSFCWSSSNNSLNGSINNPNITPTSNSTYYLTSQIISNNLVVNGNFEQGNFGFSSDYTFFPGTAGGIQGIYNISNNPNLWLNAFAACNDKTPGANNDKMLMLDGSTLAGKDFWKQVISIQPNKNYNITFWLQSIVAQNPAVIKLKINGVQVGNNITADNLTCSWKQFSTDWFSNNSSSITLSLENVNTSMQGNDFAIDDISFSESSLQYDSINVTVKPSTIKFDSITICFGNNINGHNISGNYVDRFTNAMGCDSIINLKLTVLPPPVTITESIEGCGSVTKNGVTYFASQLISTSIKNQLNCDSIIILYQIKVLPKPTNIFAQKQIITCLGNKSPTIGNYSSYLWNTGETTSTINLNGLNKYWVEVVNNSGCAGKDTITVTYNGKFETSNTNAFSPNGDLINDEFRPYTNNGCFKKYSIVIFSRSGQKLFETINPSKGWNGTFNNQPMPIGVYYYIINLETTTGFKESKSGYLTLMR